MKKEQRQHHSRIYDFGFQKRSEIKKKYQYFLDFTANAGYNFIERKFYMNTNYMSSLLAVLALAFGAFFLSKIPGLDWFFGVIVPYAALVIFVIGFVTKIAGWAKSAVPFPIATTCGQQKTLPWIEPNRIDNPSNGFMVFIRMLLEVLLFRSLFRNTTNNFDDDNKLIFKWEIWLWLFALIFHYSFLATLVRHLRFFIEPVPFAIRLLEQVDGFFQIGVPGIFLSGIALLGAVIFLLSRRMLNPQVRYISLIQDYFPLFLIIGIAGTGILMRYFAKVDITAIKALAMGLVTFRFSVEPGIDGLFFAHLFLVCVLLAYFPFSKLMHMAGIFLSPTRNMAANTREKRYVNPWNYPVKVHTYDEYEEEFREKMIEAGLPVEKE